MRHRVSLLWPLRSKNDASHPSPDLITNQQDPDYTPVYITVNVVSSRRIMDTKLHMAPVKERLHPTSQMLEQTTGSITHKFEMDGEANVCFRAGAASTNKPLLIHWNAESTDHDPLQPKAEVNQHLSHMEIELERIQKGMQIILKEADFSKEREALFHHNTLQMHAATTWWPMVQVCVLLATGFTQASHIVRFFKSRRII